MSIDANGDRYGDFSVIAMTDPEAGTQEVRKQTPLHLATDELASAVYQHPIICLLSRHLFIKYTHEKDIA